MVQRAHRVPVPMPITYRRARDDHWFHARIVNLSETGVLFAPADLEPGTSIEVILSPPIEVAGFAPGKQVCVGAIVRANGVGEVAAHFEECRFLLDA